MFFYLKQILGNHLLDRATKYGSLVDRWATTFETDLSCPDFTMTRDNLGFQETELLFVEVFLRPISVNCVAVYFII